MSLNRTLVAGVGSLIVALGTQAPKVFVSKSPLCLQALAMKSADDYISLVCGKSFGNDDLIVMFFVGIGVFAVVYFWKDIAQFLWERANSESNS